MRLKLYRNIGGKKVVQVLKIRVNNLMRNVVGEQISANLHSSDSKVRYILYQNVVHVYSYIRLCKHGGDKRILTCTNVFSINEQIKIHN